MYVKSNDLFYGPADTGIDLFGGLFTGEQEETIDITNMVYLWDAGTEVNEYPGAGIHQPARGPGGVDENGVVMPVDDEFTYPKVNETLKVTITRD